MVESSASQLEQNRESPTKKWTLCRIRAKKSFQTLDEEKGTMTLSDIARVSIALCAAVLHTSCSTNSPVAQDSYPQLRSRILILAEDCSPPPGTPVAEVKALWNVPGDYELPVDSPDSGMDARIIKYAVNRHWSQTGCSAVLVYFYSDGKIDKSLITFPHIGPHSVKIDDGRVELPHRWDDERYLRETIGWLEALQREIGERKKTSNKGLHRTSL